MDRQADSSISRKVFILRGGGVGGYDKQVLPYPNQALVFTCLQYKSYKNAPPGWLSGKRTRLMTWWFLSLIPGSGDFSFQRIFSPLTSAEACERSSRWFWKEK